MRVGLRWAQSFYYREQGEAFGLEPATDDEYRLEAKANSLHVVNRLSNIDKHRRLPVSAWWPGLVWWGRNGPTKHRYEPVPTWPWNDGDVVGRFIGPPGEAHPQHEIHLVSGDEPPWGSANSDLPKTAEGWLTSVRSAIHLVLKGYFEADVVASG